MSAIAEVKLSSILTLAKLVSTSATVADDTTMSPEGFSPGGIATYVDRSGGIALGYNRMTVNVRPPTKDSRVYKLSFKYFQPVLETVEAGDGIFGPQLAYTLQAHMDFLLPERSTLAERTAFLCRVASLFVIAVEASDGSPSTVTGSPLIGAVLNYEAPY